MHPAFQLRVVYRLEHASQDLERKDLLPLWLRLANTGIGEAFRPPLPSTLQLADFAKYFELPIPRPIDDQMELSII
jgi:hypothetical protein